MNEHLQIIKTKDISKSLIDAFIVETSDYLDIKFGFDYFFESIDQPSFIQLIGDVIKWLPLEASAAAFFSRFAIRAADDIWDNKDKILSKMKDATFIPFNRFIQSIWRLKQSSGEKTNISIGLSIPDIESGTTLHFKGNSEEEIIWYTGNFLINVQKISKVTEKETKKGNRILGGFFLKLEQDGSFIIEWKTTDNKNNFNSFKVKIS